MTESLRDDVAASAADPDVGRPEHVDPAQPGGGPGPGLPPPSATESLVSALLEAGPEVAEHVVRAAQELLLAAQAIVDAAEHAVQEQQAVRAQAQADSADDASGDDASGDDATVHHLDLAE
ncbi:MAG: hypothetical protein MUP97_13125 [Acidimicrobiia bacterium]|jgi:hypothetical protein|nr:hypothetical protein [Acidimicrobiia bacterium]